MTPIFFFAKNDENNFLLLNSNKLPKIMNRLSLSNFHKKLNNNLFPRDLSHNIQIPSKFNVFNKTSGNTGFKMGIANNNQIVGVRSTNYNFNINNNSSNNNFNVHNIKNSKILGSYNDIFKYKIFKEQNNSNNNGVSHFFNNSKNSKKFHQTMTFSDLIHSFHLNN